VEENRGCGRQEQRKGKGEEDENVRDGAELCVGPGDDNQDLRQNDAGCRGQPPVLYLQKKQSSLLQSIFHDINRFFKVFHPPTSTLNFGTSQDAMEGWTISFATKQIIEIYAEWAKVRHY